MSANDAETPARIAAVVAKDRDEKADRLKRAITDVKKAIEQLTSDLQDYKRALVKPAPAARKLLH